MCLAVTPEAAAHRGHPAKGGPLCTRTDHGRRPPRARRSADLQARGVTWPVCGRNGHDGERPAERQRYLRGWNDYDCYSLSSPPRTPPASAKRRSARAARRRWNVAWRRCARPGTGRSRLPPRTRRPTNLGAQPMIIDRHGHYTTAPSAHDRWREAQTAAFKAGGEVDPAYPDISDDQIREFIEKNQLRLLRERGADLTAFSRAPPPWPTTSATRRRARRGRATERPDQARGRPLPRNLRRRLPIAAVAGRLDRALDRRTGAPRGRAGLHRVQPNLDPSGGHWTGPPLTDRAWIPVPEAGGAGRAAMIHVSAS